MHPILRWVLVLPAFIAASVGGYVILGFVVHLVRTVNIVSQNTFVDVLLAVVGVNFIAACVGVLVGYFTAPRGHRWLAVVLALISILFTLSILILALSNHEIITQALPPVIVGSIAWILGAISGAYGAISAENEHRNTNKSFNSDAG